MVVDCHDAEEVRAVRLSKLDGVITRLCDVDLGAVEERFDDVQEHLVWKGGERRHLDGRMVG